jgi:hypothetical protein
LLEWIAAFAALNKGVLAIINYSSVAGSKQKRFIRLSKPIRALMRFPIAQGKSMDSAGC